MHGVWYEMQNWRTPFVLTKCFHNPQTLFFERIKNKGSYFLFERGDSFSRILKIYVSDKAEIFFGFFFQKRREVSAAAVVLLMLRHFVSKCPRVREILMDRNRWLFSVERRKPFQSHFSKATFFL